MALQYSLYNVLSRQWIMDIPMSTVVFNDPVTGESQLTGNLIVGSDADPQLVARIDRALVKFNTWVVVSDPTTRFILWSGILLKRPWDFTLPGYALEFHSMKWWAQHRFIGWATAPQNYNGDKFAAARAVMHTLSNGANGDPAILYDALTCGQSITYSVEARAFTSIHDALDAIGAGTKGFEWDLVTNWSQTDGLPQLYFKTYYPQITWTKNIALTYSRDGSGNIATMPTQWPDDASNQTTRQWALGGGTDGQQWAVIDADPLVGQNLLLNVENVSRYQGITAQATLSNDARTERTASALNGQTVQLVMKENFLDLADYGKGSRARLRVQDTTLNIDLPSVRVVERIINDENRDAIGIVTLTLDLSNIEEPDGLSA